MLINYDLQFGASQWLSGKELACQHSRKETQVRSLGQKDPMEEETATHSNILWTAMLEKTFESPWNYKELQPVHCKGNQSWLDWLEGLMLQYFGHNTKSWLIWNDPDAEKDWRHEEKGMTEDAMFGWHHWLNGCEFVQAPGVGDEQGGLVCLVHGVAKNQTWLSNWTDP